MYVTLSYFHEIWKRVVYIEVPYSLYYEIIIFYFYQTIVPTTYLLNMYCANLF